MILLFEFSGQNFLFNSEILETFKESKIDLPVILPPKPPRLKKPQTKIEDQQPSKIKDTVKQTVEKTNSSLGSNLVSPFTESFFKSAVSSTMNIPSVDTVCRRHLFKSEELYDKNSRRIRVPRIANCVLLGDDFFLEIAIKNLKFGYRRKNGVLGKGFCLSGMTIKKAAFKLSNCQLPRGTPLIVNVGSFDIINHHFYNEIVEDYLDLLKVCFGMGFQPIVTTLAPLANIRVDQMIILDKFNHLIRQLPLKCIDIEAAMRNEDGNCESFYYRAAPEKISGSKKTVVLVRIFY